MTTPDLFPRKVPFKPSPAFVPWFIIDFILFLGLIACCTVLPMVLAAGPEIDPVVTGAVLVGFLIITVLFIAWTRLYYATMEYELHDDEMRWRRGVWFRTTGIVPYNRITNLDLKQGPVMRWLGISTISIQTAGYSGQAVPEIRIEAIEHAEELREILRGSVRACSGTNDGTGTGANVSLAPGSPVATTGTSILILDELKRIRQLLEQQKR
ncbi:PH domain-containing protein [Methanoregula sp.]|uniref:PH domain-containing protein n=1 Tax=Methanoregula sp. TaxID=2052170 RepID=UPI00263727A5|nr:PH domain-containing protein [Methanoregula sp.]MDD5142842.1 PH domain-containing protein [Methanoregula sp.]